MRRPARHPVLLAGAVALALAVPAAWIASRPPAGGGGDATAAARVGPRIATRVETAAAPLATDPASTGAVGPAGAVAPHRAPSAVAAAPPPEVRNVTPPGVTPPPPVTGPLERVPARAVPKPAGPPALRVLRPVLVESPGTLAAGAIRVDLPDIEAPAADATCRDGAGRDWPCGARALAALRAFVRGRGVQCTVPSEAREGRFATACRIGTDDVGQWLVRHGWARAAAGAGRLAEAEAAARRERLGMWQDSVPPIASLPPE